MLHYYLFQSQMPLYIHTHFKSVHSFWEHEWNGILKKMWRITCAFASRTIKVNVMLIVLAEPKRAHLHSFFWLWMLFTASEMNSKNHEEVTHKIIIKNESFVNFFCARMILDGWMTGGGFKHTVSKKKIMMLNFMAFYVYFKMHYCSPFVFVCLMWYTAQLCPNVREHKYGI